ncbi:MAG: 1-acyl-sn-glycerol-3-phosphate acyltransferase, partial [Myxococcota bacterium]
GKRSLFRPPFGPLMRWLGGIAVNRSQRTRKVDAVADTIRNMPRGMVMIPPEGTRGKAGNWKSGFYWVAVKAEVPIVLGYLDFKKRRGGVVTTITPTGNIDQDMVTIRDAYRGVQGKHPDRQGDIALCDRKADPG